MAPEGSRALANTTGVNKCRLPLEPHDLTHRLRFSQILERFPISGYFPGRAALEWLHCQRFRRFHLILRQIVSPFRNIRGVNTKFTSDPGYHFVHQKSFKLVKKPSKHIIVVRLDLFSRKKRVRNEMIIILDFSGK